MYKLAEGLTVREFPANEFLLFNASSGEHYDINETAYFLIQHLISQRDRLYISIGELEGEMLRTQYSGFTVPGEKLMLADARKMIEFLIEESLVICEGGHS